jgi:hypothetical protein
MVATLQDARAAKQRLRAQVGQLPPINGIGITRRDGGYGIKVNLTEPVPKGLVLPKEVDGVAVEIEVVGRAVKQ